MNETRKKPATGTQYFTLFDKIFYMPNRNGTAGHTKAYEWAVVCTARTTGKVKPYSQGTMLKGIDCVHLTLKVLMVYMELYRTFPPWFAMAVVLCVGLI